MVDLIDATFNFYQTADNHKDNAWLAYYQQREWRIIRMFDENIRCYRLAEQNQYLDEGSAVIDWYTRHVMRSRIESLYPNFFTKRRLDGSSILRGTKNRDFFSFVKEVICPAGARREVGDLLTSFKCGRFREEQVEDHSVAFVR